MREPWAMLVLVPREQPRYRARDRVWVFVVVADHAVALRGTIEAWEAGDTGHQEGTVTTWPTWATYSVALDGAHEVVTLTELDLLHAAYRADAMGLLRLNTRHVEREPLRIHHINPTQLTIENEKQGKTNA